MRARAFLVLLVVSVLPCMSTGLAGEQADAGVRTQRPGGDLLFPIEVERAMMMGNQLPWLLNRHLSPAPSIELIPSAPSIELIPSVPRIEWDPFAPPIELIPFED